MLFILPSLTVAKDVFNNNQVIAASDAFSNVTGNVFLGRPWGGEWFFQLSIATLTDKMPTRLRKVSLITSIGASH